MTVYNSSIDIHSTWNLGGKVAYSIQQCQVVQRATWPSQQTKQCSHPHDVSTSPDVIILCLWPQATAEQIEYYVSGYDVLYPGAKVILLRNNSDTLDYEEALEDLLGNDVEKPASLDGQNILLHLFGTSGAARACTLLRGYRLHTGAPLSVGVVVADTAPVPSLTTALTSSQPISSALYSFILAFWFRLQQLVWAWPLDWTVGQVHQDLNNPSPAACRSPKVLCPGAQRSDALLDEAVVCLWRPIVLRRQQRRATRASRVRSATGFHRRQTQVER